MTSGETAKEIKLICGGKKKEKEIQGKAMVRVSSKGLFRVQSTYTGRSGRKGIQGLLNLNRPKREKENKRTYIATKGEKEVQRSKETLPMKGK